MLNMLTTLKSITQEVASARSLDEVLDMIVLRVKDAIETDVCSVYIHDQAIDRYVFMATEGLNKSACGKVSLSPDEGLVGLVVRKEETINLDDAESHPEFQYLSGIGEDPFKSFLGVPVIHQRGVLGVLVVQQKIARRFDESEEAFLITLSAQLAGIIAHAQATGSIKTPGYKRFNMAKFQGLGGASGVVLGRALLVTPLADIKNIPSKECSDINEEVLFFRQCVERVRGDIRNLAAQLEGRLAAEEHALFDVYLRMVDDDALPAEVEKKIHQGEWAEGSLSQVISEHVKAFQGMDDPYLSERATDLIDIGQRLLHHLQRAQARVLEYHDKTILMAEELTASMLAEVPEGRLVGLVSVKGSRNSHVAILARSMGIPSVMGVDLPYGELDGHELVVDGYSGLVYSDPEESLRAYYEVLLEEERTISRGLAELRDLPCETIDGYRVPLLVNTGLMSDVGRSIDQGAEGVGLYRTEVPFLLRDRFPTEEEQRAIYRQQLEAFAPHPVTMRTLDIGGDKALPYFPISEDNPFLGWRGIRVSLDHPELFLVQVRAMMRANIGLGNLRIMLPMISNVTELEEALELIYRARIELEEENVDSPLPPIGVMIEVPAAVYQARDLARRVDFLSVGSNDLTQYLLAVDRNNPRVADLYHTYHPAVFQALYRVVQSAKKEGKPVSICGELAGDPGAATLLVAMGYDSLSMNANNLPRVKSVIRLMEKKQIDNLLKRVLRLDTTYHIEEAVDSLLKRQGVTRLLRPLQR